MRTALEILIAALALLPLQTRAPRQATHAAPPPRAAEEPTKPPAIRGMLRRSDGQPIADAQIILRGFEDEACKDLYASREASAAGQEKLAACSKDLLTVQATPKGEFFFSGVQPGWYAVRFLWNIEPKPGKSPSADRVGEFLVIYAGKKDSSGRYDTLSHGSPFFFDAEKDYRIEFKY